MSTGAAGEPAAKFAFIDPRDESTVMVPESGLEWIVDAAGCRPSALADLSIAQACCEEIIERMQLHVAAPPVWRQFPGPGGVTGLYLLSESHLTCHTFPEHGLLSLNVYCCRPRQAPDWEQLLGDCFAAERVSVRELVRGLEITTLLPEAAT